MPTFYAAVGTKNFSDHSMFRLGNIFFWPTKDNEVVKRRQDKQSRVSEKICAQIIPMDAMINDKRNHFRWFTESTEIGNGFYPKMQFFLGVQSFDDMIPQTPLQLYFFSIFNSLLILLVLAHPTKFSS